MRYWIEKALVAGNPIRGNPQYAIGAALISPRESESGTDIYANLRKVAVGDVVLHLTDSAAFTHISEVAEPYGEINLGFETWYRVPLKNSEKLDPPLHRSVFFSAPYRERLRALVIECRRSIFFTRDMTLRQGNYLTPAEPDLMAILDAAYESVAKKSLMGIERRP